MEAGEKTMVLNEDLDEAVVRKKVSILSVNSTDDIPPAAGDDAVQRKSSILKKTSSISVDDGIDAPKKKISLFGWGGGEEDVPHKKASILKRMNTGTRASARDSVGSDVFRGDDRCSTRDERMSMLYGDTDMAYSTSSVRSVSQGHGEQKVNRTALHGDKGFKAGLVLSREALSVARTLVDEISVPLTDLQWRERLHSPEYKILRLRQMEKPFTGRYLLSTGQPRQDGIYRCKGCCNFLFDIRDTIPGNNAHLIFDQVLPGGLVSSLHPLAKPFDVDCSICLSFIGRLNDQGFVTNSAAVFFDALSKREIGVVHKMCSKRWKSTI